MFDSEWKHSGTTAKLKRIYVIKNRKDPKFQLGFHGTRRACTIGSDSTDPCDNPECCLCSILKDGFSLERAQADRYVKNYENNSDERVLILCGVEFLRTQELKMAGDPGANVDTVIGVTKANGGELFYHETAVRSVEQIKPLGLVVYSRCPP
ncbi:hypothetical protein N7456_010300 [Penicillium angulare]|uniref:Uncharacterized protein n=1 Tax=Penicillium angulare TaxID=116970 RepID=A0A9W9K627_9EURO|nr:hypothetical protein N7456_010300 [Penicillium angulare]